MTTPCPCGSPATVRHGPQRRHYLRPAGGTVEKAPCQAERFLCRSCGRTFTVLPPHAADCERQVRDLVAEIAFARGRSGAVRATGLGEAVVNRLVDRWQAEREIDVADAAPDFILIDVVPMRDGPAILVADLDHEALVEIAAGKDGLVRWLSRPGSLQPLRAGLPVDAALAHAVRAAAPGIQVMVAPSAVVRAVRAALTSGLSFLRRDPSMARRNAFPGGARFLRAFDGRAAVGEGWPVEVLALLSAGRAARAVATAPDAAAGARLWREFELAASVPGGAPLLRLMATWRDAILAGLDHRFVDRLTLSLAKVRRAAVARRPSLLVRDFRGLALLRDCERGTAAPVPPGMDGGTRPLGRPLVGLANLLSSAIAPAPCLPA